MIVTKKLSILFAALLLLAVTVSPAFAAVPGEQINVSINGVTSTVPVGPVNASPIIKPVPFTNVEQPSGIYLEIDPASIGTNTLTGHFLMLSPPFYLDGHHELNAMYGTFTKDNTTATSRMEYTREYYGVWQWVYDEHDSNKVMVRLGKDEFSWKTLWMYPLYEVYYRDTVHITTQAFISPINNRTILKTAAISVLDHHFSKMW